MGRRCSGLGKVQGRRLRRLWVWELLDDDDHEDGVRYQEGGEEFEA